MNKLKLLALVLVFVFSFSVVVMAAPAVPDTKTAVKTVKTALTTKTAVKTAVVPTTKQPVKAVKTVPVNFAGPTTVVAGQQITFTATTLKQGSAYTENWKVTNSANVVILQNPVTAVKSSSNGNYISTAIFNAQNLMPGTYTVDYMITMTAGNSSTAFVGTVTKTITVVAQGTKHATDFAINQATFVKQGNNPNNIFQLVITEMLVTYSDNTSNVVTLTGDNIITVGGFKENEIGRKFDVTFMGITKQFTTTVPVVIGPYLR